MITDFLGKEIKKGSIVARAKHSSFTFHEVLGFTNKSIILSTSKTTYTNHVRYYDAGDGRGFRYHDTPRLVESSYRMDTVDIEKVLEHEDKFYFHKDYAKAGLIVVL